ncbi:transposase [Cesiribacter sp. SM1]|uniref:ISAon1 family transposase N-terminal region protein n=1 Tax=Cesiribacter sp. SM1 TaxID=2861196 RepID=UPI001CD596E2|nr:transposase [Cesiribacter sp. SM1]
MEDKHYLRFLLPEGLLEYFEVNDIKKESQHYIIYLEEKNVAPAQYQQDKLLSKGFYDEVTIQDFPLRGRACFLKVKRRRWHNETTGAVVSRDWELVAKGTRMTAEFAAFLKGIAR